MGAGDGDFRIAYTIYSEFLEHEAVAICFFVKHLDLGEFEGFIIITLPDIHSELALEVVAGILGPVQIHSCLQLLKSLNKLGFRFDGDCLGVKREDIDGDRPEGEVADSKVLWQTLRHSESDVIAGLDFDYLHGGRAVFINIW